MSVLTDLVNQIDDIALRERIQKEVNKLAKQKKFGLVFEEHMPECTPLYDMPIKAGTTVAKRAGSVNDIYKVLRIEDGVATCIHKESQETCTIDVAELVAVAEFGESIYPYLKPLDSVCNAPDSDLWHTLIEADNYHALQLLEYLYAGKVDCIYIDPPYNTGAQDWKYNNDYVDDNDTYRHSKWLSFMQKRLLLAKKLLNPKESMLIVTIDEKEYLHLGCLLEELFPEASMQMISSVIKNGTSMRQYEFSRCNEYIFYLRFGTAVISKEIPENISTSIPWRPLMRSGTGSNNFRPNRPNSFYPIFVDTATGKLHHVGDPLLPSTVPRSSISVPSGLTVIWPLDTEGRERVWGASPETLKEYFSKGYAKITHKSAKFGVQYITTGVINDIDAGKLIVTGRDSDGGIAGNYSEGKAQMPQNQWNIASHNATTYGTNLLKDMIGNRFTFPKSLYAVHDCLRHAIRDKKDALVVDFFAGSGTTMHAINLMNAEDGGCRRCILVTNNEVSAEEALDLSKRNIKPGDSEWNALGIAQYVTWPRTVCSIKGCDVNGKPLKGNYIGSEAPMANGFKSNAAFFRLGFLDRTAVALGMTFNEMLPVLWMKAGAVGRCPTAGSTSIPNILILPENKMAILINENAFATFAEELAKRPEIQTVFLATDYDINYRSMVKNLNVQNTYQLYRDYLDHFRLNRGRS